MAKFNENRKFGVEIEFTNTVSREAVAARITAKGIACYVEGYNHTTKNNWKVVTDGSCGNELVSPPLKGREGLTQLETVCEALKELGVKVDVKCGLHVHHDINDYTIENMKALFLTYGKLEKAIDSFMPNSRRSNNNTFCKSLSVISIENFMDKIKNVKSISDMSNAFSSRYYKLNFQSYLKYGTIEFRQHSGTIEFEKIYNWVLLTQHMVENAKVRKVNYSFTERWNTLHLLTCVLGLTKANGADEEYVQVLRYFRGRAKQLAPAA